MGQPIRGTTRPLPVKAGIIPAVIPPEVITLDANFNASIHNRFDVEVIDAQTRKVKQRAQAENVICNGLWTRLFAPNTYFNYIHYGTGTGTPASTDTSLFTFLNYGTPSTSDNVYSIDGINGIASLRRKIQLSETAAVGSTLTEVGIGYSTSSSSLCTHAMLKDANGNQISIAKTATDIINIYATVYVHYMRTSSAGIVTLADTNGIMRYILGMYDSGKHLPPQYCYCAQSNAIYGTSNVSAITAAYNSTSKKITLTMARIGASSCNMIGGINDLILSSYVYIASGRAVTNYSNFCLTSGGTWYPGSSITSEAIGTGDGSTSNFSAAFPIGGSCTIYVDGVENSNVTIDLNMPKLISDMGAYFQEISSQSTDTNLIFVPGVAPCASNEAQPDGIQYFYNPNHAIGIKSFSNYNTDVYASDDLETWVTIASAASATVTINSTYRSYKYWKIDHRAQVAYRVSAFTANADSLADIHFTTPPASGAVITADYHTPVIAKDTNHVFDLTVTIQLGEYTE